MRREISKTERPFTLVCRECHAAAGVPSEAKALRGGGATWITRRVCQRRTTLAFAPRRNWPEGLRTERPNRLDATHDCFLQEVRRGATATLVGFEDGANALELLKAKGRIGTKVLRGGLQVDSTEPLASVHVSRIARFLVTSDPNGVAVSGRRRLDAALTVGHASDLHTDQRRVYLRLERHDGATK